MIQLEQFQRTFCARPGMSLISAPIYAVDRLGLPRDSVVHYATESSMNLGIRPSHPLLRNWENDIRLFFVEDWKLPYGRTKRRVFNPTTFKRGFFQRNKTFRRAPDLDRALLAERSLVVVDYSLIVASATYQASQTVYQDSWRNILVNQVEYINKVGRMRNQFIALPMPQTWLNEAALKLNAEEIELSYRDRFRESSLQWIREIFATMMGFETELSKVKYPDRLYFTFVEGQMATTVSLSTLLDLAEKSLAEATRGFHDLLEKLLTHRTVTDTEALAKAEAEQDGGKGMSETAAGVPLTDTVPDTLSRRVQELAQAGKLTDAEQKRLLRLAENIPVLAAPDGSGLTLAEYAEVKPEDTVLSPDINCPANPDTVPEHAMESTVTNLKADYVRNLMNKDIANMLMSLNRAGVLMTNFKITEEADALEETRKITFTLVPVNGKAATTTIEMPKFEEDGTFTIDGIRYTLDSQKVDAPIRKTKIDQAALTSYFGKLFIDRSPLVKHNYSAWLNRKITNAGGDAEDLRVTRLQRGSQKIPNIKLPRDYTALMGDIIGFTTGNIVFDFAYRTRLDRLGEDKRGLEKPGLVYCGHQNNQPMFMDMSGMLHVSKSGRMEAIGNLLEVTGGGWGAVPRDIAVIRVLGRRVPVVFLLGYYMGLDKLLRYTKAEYRYVPLTERVKAAPDEVVVPFSDDRLVIKVSDPVQSLLWAGLADMEDATKQYATTDYNRPSGWKASIGLFRANAGHFIEYDLMEELFLDPITIEVLQKMEEPTDFYDLLLRCVELVSTDDAPDEADTLHMRHRGMERIAGHLYLLMVNAIREQRRMPNPAMQPISLSPNAMRMALNEDSSVQQVAEINPIHNLKEQEAVTQAGEGGRQARTLVKRNRVFHGNDLGIISEHTPDSSKVGIRGFFTPNAKLEDHRGMAGVWQPEDGSTSLLSTTSLTLPDMDRDDGKRANLGAVQQSAVVPAAGYHVMPYRTGYDSIIASRVSPFFVFRAAQAGLVTKVTDSVIEVVYHDGKREGYALGVKHGSVSGELIPHEYVTDLTVGHEFAMGHVLAWNKGFFARDFFAPANVVMLSGCLANVALMEGNDTLEDGAAISEAFRAKLMTRISKQKGILVDFDQEIQGLVQVGDTVEYTTSLCTLTEGALAGLEQTDASLAALAKLGNMSPKAKFEGVVTRVEIFYIGDLDDMSPSLRALVEADNRRRAKHIKALNTTKAGRTGLVKRPTFVAGEKLVEGKAIISIYIDSDLDFGVGDKLVVSNQLKSVPGRVMNGINETEDGNPIDLIFGWRSVNDRIVRSCIVQGAMYAVQKAISMKLAEEYMAAA